MTDAAKPPARAKAKAKPEVIDVEVDEADETAGYRELEFNGDTLLVRSPTQQALAAFSLGTSKHVPSNMRNDLTGLFISNHLAPASYERVFSRLMDPTDDQYDVESIGTLMRLIVELS
jgi:hypothetical protein